IGSLLGDQVLSQLPADHADYLTGRSFFPQLISGPFADGLAVAFGFAIVACLIAAIASWLRGGRYVYSEPSVETILPGGDGPGPDAATVRIDEGGDEAVGEDAAGDDAVGADGPGARNRRERGAPSARPSPTL